MKIKLSKRDVERGHVVMGQICPYCGKHHDRATQINGENVPKMGDFTFCNGCGKPSVFDMALNMVKPTAEEITLLRAHPDAQRFIKYL